MLVVNLTMLFESFYQFFTSYSSTLVTDFKSLTTLIKTELFMRLNNGNEGYFLMPISKIYNFFHERDAFLERYNAL
jgi:hypothetical protein